MDPSVVLHACLRSTSTVIPLACAGAIIRHGKNGFQARCLAFCRDCSRRRRCPYRRRSTLGRDRRGAMVEARDYSGRGSALLLVERRRSPASAPIVARLSSRSSTGCAGADVRVRFLRARCSVALADEGAEHHFGHYALTGSVDEAPPLLPACERPFTRRCRGFSELKRTERVPLDLPLLAS
jgi:hypothetical protein